jgi:hypothetical protein
MRLPCRGALPTHATSYESYVLTPGLPKDLWPQQQAGMTA